ncbi:MAG: hypothetical protein WCB96_07725 [Candidatus Aminicenantales bacterium]
MIRKRSSLSAWAFFSVLVFSSVLWAQEKFKKPNVSQNQAVLTMPNIAGIKVEHMGYPTPEVGILGTNFGATQGTKQVRADGNVAHLINASWAWGDKLIWITFPYIPWEHVYQFCIVDNGKVISNVFSYRFLYHYEKLNPDKGPVGTEVKLTVFMLPNSPAGLALKIGNANMSVTSWVGGGYGKIVATVPAGVSPGEYDVYLQKGTDVVSNKLKFKVQYPPILLP